MLISPFFLDHSLVQIRVYQLVSQSAERQVRSLRNVENLVKWGLVYCATRCGPQLSQDSEEGRFSTTVRPCDHQVHAWRD